VNDFADRFALQAEFTADGQPPAMTARAKAEVLRIVQEALANVRKHADATMVRVSVQSAADVRVRISDNGRGFRPDLAPTGFGLDSMRQRAALIGATLSVSSRPRDGTTVELVVPRVARGEEADG
jgi:signal transduction histidine kinase